MLLTVVVTAANVQDRQAAKAVFLEAVDDASSLELVWADSGYQGQLETSVPIVCGFSLFNCQTHRTRIQAVTSTLGCRADICMAWTQPSFE